MKHLELTLPSPAENLALDEALLLEAEAGRGGEILRLWEWREPAVIIGVGCRLAEDVNESACRRDNLPVLRRSSGGGTVLLSSGCLCYALVLSYKRDAALQEIRSSTRYILERIRGSLLSNHPDIVLAGTSDLALEGKKFSGNSQQRKRHFFLHHGTFLYSMDLNMVDCYLRMPRRQPEYRQQRDHVGFLTNLRTDPELLKRRLLNAWKALPQETSWPREIVHQLVESKYERPEWTCRR
jgi:lipoate-protein ligase A